MLSQEIPGTVVLKNSGNPGSVVAQGPRFPGRVGVVFQLPPIGGAQIFTGTAPTSSSICCSYHEIKGKSWRHFS